MHFIEQKISVTNSHKKWEIFIRRQNESTFEIIIPAIVSSLWIICKCNNSYSVDQTHFRKANNLFVFKRPFKREKAIDQKFVSENYECIGRIQKHSRKLYYRERVKRMLENIVQA